MTIQDDIFSDKHVQKALNQLCKEVVEVAKRRGTDLHFLTFALGLKDGGASVSRAGCRCIARADLASRLIMADALGLDTTAAPAGHAGKAVH